MRIKPSIFFEESLSEHSTATGPRPPGPILVKQECDSVTADL